MQGFLREIAKDKNGKNWDPEVTIRMVHQNFREENKIGNYLSSREPSCVLRR
jgi:hypothetical protein